VSLVLHRSWENGVHIVSKCDVVILHTSLVLMLILQMQTHCYKVNHTTYITMYFVKYSPSWKMFQTKTI